PEIFWPASRAEGSSASRRIYDIGSRCFFSGSCHMQKWLLTVNTAEHTKMREYNHHASQHRLGDSRDAAGFGGSCSSDGDRIAHNTSRSLGSVEPARPPAGSP